MGKKQDVIEEDELALVSLGQGALHLNNTDLASVVNVSRRTVSRWFAKQSPVGPAAIATLAHAVHESDPALAARLWAHAERECVRMGVSSPAPLPAPPPAAPSPAAPLAEPPAPPPPSPRTLLDSVVCAACDASDLPPRAIRPVLLAAFRRARELGVSVADVERELSPPPRRRSG